MLFTKFHIKPVLKQDAYSMVCQGSLIDYHSERSPGNGDTLRRGLTFGERGKASELLHAQEIGRVLRVIEQV